MIRRLSLVLGFLFFLPLAGHAAEPKPIISIEAPVFFGNLRIDDGLRRFPMLYAYIFAEAKEKLVANQRDAELDLAGVAPDQYNHSSDDIHYELRAAVGPFVSVEQNETSYTGGAHANAVVTTLLWNLREQRPATLAELFTESADDGPTLRAFYKLAENDLARTLKKIGEPARKPYTGSFASWAIGVPILLPSTVPGKSSGLAYYYQYLNYDSHVRVAFVPWQALRGMIKSELVPLFAGERPASDVQRFSQD